MAAEPWSSDQPSQEETKGGAGEPEEHPSPASSTTLNTTGMEDLNSSLAAGGDPLPEEVTRGPEWRLPASPKEDVGQRSQRMTGRGDPPGWLSWTIGRLAVKPTKNPTFPQRPAGEEGGVYNPSLSQIKTFQAGMLNKHNRAGEWEGRRQREEGGREEG